MMRIVALILMVGFLGGCQQIIDRLAQSWMPAATEETHERPPGADPVTVLAPASPTTQEPQPPRVFRDCPDCPAMLRVISGRVLTGSPLEEAGRDPDESPRVDVKVNAFAMGQFEITRGQWQQFEQRSGYRAKLGCLQWQGDGYALEAQLSWRYPGFAQTDHHPVVCVSWRDAQAYVRWLSQETGHRYRLPSAAEWEFAARAGRSTAFSWGSEALDHCTMANLGDAALTAQRPRLAGQTCDDGFAFTAPVGSYPANPWGFQDLQGNVMEWVEDCWTPQPAGWAGDAAAAPSCRSRVMKGGGWDLPSRFARSAYRGKSGEDNRGNGVGFRVVRALP